MRPLAIVALLAALAGCTSTGAPRTTTSTNPNFLCSTADYVRNHIVECSSLHR